MADTWTLLNGYSNSEYVDTQVFEVDSATKKIRPISGQPLVAGEKNSQYIRFEMDRYWDGIDVSAKEISITYFLAGAYYGTSEAVSAEVTDSRLRFGWIVPEEACCVSGTLLFVLVLQGTDYILKTQIAETPVVKTIDEDTVIPEPTKEAWYKTFREQVQADLNASQEALDTAQTAVRIANSNNAELQEAMVVVNNAVEEAKVRYGSPLVANAGPEMVETNRVYVFTGSESAYTYGHWYYYDNGVWNDGGVYNGNSVNTDKTLSVENMPADAKATGDAFNELKSDLNIVNDGKSYLPDYKIIKNQYVQYNGVISDYNGWDRTDYLEVVPNEKLFYYSQNNLSYIKFYNSNKEPLSVGTTINSSQTEYVVPNDSRIKYWIISGSASDMAVFKLWRNSPLINDTTVNSNKTYSSSMIESLLSSVAKTTLINRFNKATISEGYFLSAADGSLSANSDFFASDFIDVHDLDKVKCSYTHIVCFYDANKTFVSGQGFNTNSADAFIDRPSNACYFRFSNYNNHIDSAQIGENVSRENYVPYGKYLLDGLVLTNDSIVVDISGDGDYTSLTEALYENVDSGEDIVVKAGAYNIVAEYVNLFGQSAVDNMADADRATFNGFQYGAIIRNRKITFEAGSHIVCDWTGHTVDGTHRFSALRVDYNAEIIGLDLVATATFYAIHDDYGINAPYTVKYENCRVKGIDLYNANCIGGGCKSYSRHILKNCYFDNGLTGSATVRYHNTNAEGAEPEIFVSNCYFNNWFTPRWYGTQTSKMRVYVNNCEARAIYKLAETASYNVDNVELYKWCNTETNPLT